MKIFYVLIFPFCRIVLSEMETVDSLKMRMALRLLIPAVNFHILHNKKELRYCKLLCQAVLEFCCWFPYSITIDSFL